MQILRTPDDRFADLPGFPYEPSYASTSDGLRMAYVDEGSGPVVLLLHGEPSWSYLYRTMIPVLVDAGLRCVAPDLIGFGRSDKPTDPADYTYARHVEWLRSVLFDALDLSNITLVGQDWGGLLGLRLVAEAVAAGDAHRFARVCAANTGLPDGSHRMPEPYDAPFPDATYKAGPRAFPDLIPQTADDPATPDNVRAWQVLSGFDKPFLCAFSDQDPITAGGERMLLRRIPGAAGQPHTTIAGAGHFLQEDRGEQLAGVVAQWARA